MDLIDREQTIKAIDDFTKGKPLYEYPYQLIEVIKGVPSAEKTGKWIKLDGCDTVQCSKCLEDFDYIDGLCYLCHGQELPNYCPNCGARMVE